MDTGDLVYTVGFLIRLTANYPRFALSFGGRGRFRDSSEPLFN
jgi:hypothetical protein